MTNLKGFKKKYTVIKNEDVLALSTGEEWMKRLEIICKAVNRNRLPKTPNTYLVINVDEPYADEVIEILKRNGHWG